MFSICVHEWAHAAMALRCGDDTAARAGHLSLNPMVQMGPVSLVYLAILGIAWGAVPVDVSLLQKRSHEAWVAFAGPLSNLVLMVICSLLFMVVMGFTVVPEGGTLGTFVESYGVQSGAAFYEISRSSPVLLILYYAALANATLFILNMLPVPVLDGWSVLSQFIPRMKWVPHDTAMTISTICILVILVTPLGFVVWGGGEIMADMTKKVSMMVLGVFGL